MRTEQRLRTPRVLVPVGPVLAAQAGHTWSIEALEAAENEQRDLLAVVMLTRWDQQRMDAALREVEERAERFREHWASIPTRPPRGLTPKGAALRSLHHDMVTGVWR